MFSRIKSRRDISAIIKELWPNRWGKYVQLEASGTRGGIIILWDSRVWEGEISSLGSYSITCKFSGKTQELNWHLFSVYAPNNTTDREEVWWELAGARGLFTGPLVVCGDFNTVRFPSEKKNANKITKAMDDFFEFIEDMVLIDLPLSDEKYICRKGDRRETTAWTDSWFPWIGMRALETLNNQQCTESLLIISL